MMSAPYPYDVQSLLDYARLRMRQEAKSGRFSDRSRGYIGALRWLKQIDQAEVTAFDNEMFFLVGRARIRRIEQESGAKS
ncbi:MAG: hypothetical protein H6948_15150 [Zoogloeaceae bacterium]|nr:hypothetical protein [Zoogloeaceae bacterium]